MRFFRDSFLTVFYPPTFRPEEGNWVSVSNPPPTLWGKPELPSATLEVLKRNGVLYRRGSLNVEVTTNSWLVDVILNQDASKEALRGRDVRGVATTRALWIRAFLSEFLETDPVATVARLLGALSEAEYKECVKQSKKLLASLDATLLAETLLALHKQQFVNSGPRCNLVLSEVAAGALGALTSPPASH